MNRHSPLRDRRVGRLLALRSGGTEIVTRRCSPTPLIERQLEWMRRYYAATGTMPYRKRPC